jgi:hypothetical protein
LSLIAATPIFQIVMYSLTVVPFFIHRKMAKLWFGVTIPLNRDFRSGSADFKQNSVAMLARAR